MMLDVLRFFRAADPTPSWLLLLSAVIAVYAAAIVAMDPEGTDEALAVVLLWQMFCASRGFRRQASAGHFDAALVRWGRGAVGAGHLMHSVWLGTAMWVLAGAVEVVIAWRWPSALEPGRGAAFAFVSVAAWALALPAARLVTGSLWLMLIVASATTRFGVDQYAAMVARPDGGVAQTLHAVALVLVCPFLMIGDHVPPRGATAGSLAVAAVVAAAAGLLYIRRRDYPLEPSL